MFVCNYCRPICTCIMYINMKKFNEIHLTRLKFSTVNDNDDIIDIQKYHYYY